MLIDPWKFREQKQLECYKELIYKSKAIKLGIVCVILANVARGGRKETRRWWSGRVTEPSSNCQQEGLLPGTVWGVERPYWVLRACSPILPSGKACGSSLGHSSSRPRAPLKDKATGIAGSAQVPGDLDAISLVQ